jgi:hypothetical protein
LYQPKICPAQEFANFAASSGLGEIKYKYFVLTSRLENELPHKMLVIHDYRRVVKDRPVKGAIALAYCYANKDRDKYASVFHRQKHSLSRVALEPGETHDSSQISQQHDKRQRKVVHYGNIDDVDTSKDPENDAPPEYRFRTYVSFPTHDAFKSYAWKRVETFQSKTPDLLYLNPKLLDEYERMSTGSDKARLLVLIHCVVCHELAHLLHFKIHNTLDQYFGEPSSKSDVDCGTEVEYLLFGGRILSAADFSRLRVERKDGTTFDLDSDYFFKEFLRHSGRRKIDFETLSKVIEEGESENQRWLGMGEINGTHDRQICDV